MKKTILFSVLILVFLVGILLTTDNNVNSNTIKKTSATYLTKVHVSGCTSCLNVTYCVDGGQLHTVPSCVFTVDEAIGDHVICIHCPSVKSGYFNFTVHGYPYVEDLYVTVSSNGSDCNCTDAKH